ncbi:MAG TPA: hypothetical protein VLF68_00270 [Candidatus Saccharimonadales bacterium]|nr:hypothetical protein [Candidatus Saccharimonadales bacterium]
MRKSQTPAWFCRQAGLLLPYCAQFTFEFPPPVEATHWLLAHAPDAPEEVTQYCPGVAPEQLLPPFGTTHPLFLTVDPDGQHTPKP